MHDMSALGLPYLGFWAVRKSVSAGEDTSKHIAESFLRMSLHLPPRIISQRLRPMAEQGSRLEEMQSLFLEGCILLC